MDQVRAIHRDGQVLDLWDPAVGLNRWARDDAVLGGRLVAPRSLGGRNLAFLALRTDFFGARWPLQSCCPECGTEVEFAANSAVLAAELSLMVRAEVMQQDWLGGEITLTAPTVDDLIAAAGQPDPVAAGNLILTRCSLDAVDVWALTAQERETLSDLIEAVDPAAALSFELTCPACGTNWSAMVDVAEAFWAELRRAAEGALVQVDALARAYGWTEPDVMALTPHRRAAYLQLVQAQ